LRRFDISPDGKTAILDNTRPIALSTVAGIIRTVAYKAGIRKGQRNIKIDIISRLLMDLGNFSILH
jgi:hypothetical protein